MPSLSLARARAILASLAERSILIVGDVMLDHFLFGRVHRISPEAPVPVVEFDHEHFRLGGAANVASNVTALGGRATLVGVVGEDDPADRLKAALRDRGISADSLVCDSSRCTTRKLRIVTTRQQQVARVDYELDGDIAGAIQETVIAYVESAAPRADIIVVSDYLKGVITQEVMRGVMGCARARGIRVLVDPKIPHLELYGGVTLITPNQVEAEIATHLRIRSDDDARRAARALRDQVGCASVVITRGEHGIWILDGSESGHASLGEGVLPAATREVADVTGAGDTVISTLALALAGGATLAEAAEMANHAAGVAVSHFGPAPVTRDELDQALASEL
ncbi:MAG: D-glycero-beta-D-manno-heptose-7-phosphate kinase [Luteitalea sp.]|nr:D-glycero-beta-D-manno-heptose-7-phosphate kinase [Luteitalea sp.]